MKPFLHPIAPWGSQILKISQSLEKVNKIRNQEVKKINRNQEAKKDKKVKK